MLFMVLAGALSFGDPVAYWREIAETCAGYPSKPGCDDGDMLLFSGLLCASGEEAGCAQVRDSQTPDGRWWRSPRRKNGNIGAANSFSRDMSLGALAYIAVKKDKGAAQRWLGWIDAHRACLAQKPGGGCMVRGPYRFCTDDTDHRCTLTASSWALIGHVWEGLGLETNASMRAGMAVDTDVLVEEARTTDLGYALHLSAVDVFIKQVLAMNSRHYADAVTTIAERQPENPFFRFLAGDPAESIWTRLVELCPRRGTDRPPGPHQWAWERATEEHAWEQSMGWDCVFLANLLNQRIVAPDSSSR